MRLTDDRYAGERSQFELALRMIHHEARTRTIRECTGLSDDRIRKLFGTYFQNPATAHQAAAWEVATTGRSLCKESVEPASGDDIDRVVLQWPLVTTRSRPQDTCPLAPTRC